MKAVTPQKGNLLCPVCSAENFAELVSFGEQPLSAHLLASPEEQVLLHEGRYVYCRNCRFIRQAEFVPADLQYARYEYFSGDLLPAYAKDLARRICQEVIPVTSGAVIEIGSNDGGFLQLLKDRGISCLLGIEPSEVLASHANSRGLETLTGFFEALPVDQILKERKWNSGLIVARFVLEHVTDLEAFLRKMVSLAHGGTRMLIEVPDVDFILERAIFTGFWDQHANYFNLHTLQRLAAGHGLEIYQYEYDYNRNERILRAWLRLADYPKSFSYPPTPLSALKGFPRAVSQKLGDIRTYCRSKHEEGRRLFLYGASHTPANIVNYSGIGKFLQCALDGDERKAGKYLPGSKLKVVSVNRLADDLPDYCLIAALGSEDRIVSRHADYLRRGGAFVRLFPRIEAVESGSAMTPPVSKPLGLSESRRAGNGPTSGRVIPQR